MPTVHANSITLEYELAGPKNGPVVLMIMGLAGQMIYWPDPLLESFHKAGYRTLRFDNRDIGKSHKFHSKKPPHVVMQMGMKRLGVTRRTPYKLEDMAKDARGLLNALGIDKVHVMGVSMGGMITQIFAAQYPERVLSVTPIMSTTNHRSLPGASAEISKFLFRPGKLPTTREAAIERNIKVWSLIGTKESGSTPEEVRARMEAAFDRSHYPVGPKRQVAAIIATGDMRKYARKIKAPTLVIHGSDDPLVPLPGGKDIAKTVPNASLEIIDGMGHDLPKKYLPKLAELMIAHFGSVEQAISETEAA